MKKERKTEIEIRAICAKNLCFLRKSRKHKVSQRMLARKLNLPEKTIMNYETGKSSPSAYALYLLADYYGYSMEELLTNELVNEGVIQNE